MAVSLAMVFLNQGAVIDAQAITHRLVSEWPEITAPKNVASDRDIVILEFDDASCFISRMPIPIPFGDLEGPCSTSWLWPTASDDLLPHTEHLIVSITSDEPAIARTTLLTKLLAAILGAVEQAIGVYWGNATLVVSSEVFREFATTFLPEGPTAPLWVDFRVGTNEDGTSWGYTTGLHELDLLEFEARSTPRDPGELRQQLINFACYVLENGPVLKHGNTIGGDANEKIGIAHACSMFDSQRTVIQLSYTSQPPRRRLFGRRNQ